MKRFSFVGCLLWALACATSSSVQAAIIASGFFSGTLIQFDATTGAQSTFSNIASVTDPFPGLSGMAYDAARNRIYASARISNRVYSVNATTGAVDGFVQLANGSSPAGLAIDSAGNVYVANNGGNTISTFDSNLNSTGSITLPDFGVGDNLPSGLAFDGQGNLVISTFAGVGVIKYNPVGGTFSSFAPSPLANNQIAIDASGNVYVGEAAFSNAVEKFDSNGASLGSITIDASLLPQPQNPFLSPDFTSPSGVALDANGNLIVAALGRTNPTSVSDNFQSNGGLFLFAPDGTPLQTYAVQTTPLSSVIVTAVPEPASMALVVMGGAASYFVRRRQLAKRLQG